MYREFLATNIEGVQSVGTVGVVLEEVFFALGEFLAKLGPCGSRCALGRLLPTGWQE